MVSLQTSTKFNVQAYDGDSGSDLGQIAWSSSRRVRRAKVDTYSVRFGRGLPAGSKAVILCAAFLIDAVRVPRTPAHKAWEEKTSDEEMDTRSYSSGYSPVL